MRESSSRVIAAIGAGLALAVTLAACGDNSSGQDPVHAATGSFPVKVTTASFPLTQRLAQPTTLTIAVRNVGHRALPDVSVSICNVTCAASAPRGEGTSAQPFGHDIAAAPDTANPSRPLWILERGPGACLENCAHGGASSGAGVTSDANTWALGRLAPGQTARFRWALTAVEAGRHVVAWQVSGDLAGAARATTSSGAIPQGTFKVDVRQAAAQVKVTPSGKVVTAGR